MTPSKMHNIEIVREPDTATYRAVMEVFAEAFEDAATYSDAPPGDAYILERLADRNFILLAARDGNRIVGGLAAYVLRKFERERSEVYIYDLAVRTSHRRRGIATDMINALKVVAARRGAYVIFVQADYGDEPAIALYESLGVREEVLHYDILVE